MTRITAPVEGPTELDQVWGKRRAYYEIFMQDYNASVGRVDPVLLELCRIRIAELVESGFDLSLRYQPAREAGVTEEKIGAVARYPESALFSDRERAALEFTEQFVIQSSAIFDQDVARVQAHLNAEEFIYLTKALGVMDQFARANSAFRIAPTASAPSTMPAFAARPATA
ncbi:carboxymuconolactone decarboxylase family protein [Streptomyces sp. NBC_00076]|uniref:carboxymuconolactone decarboxylase family protein n=1 Tax=Streptomyces sp. NBC_00076 TaxID=2975642 RepID=UPI00324EA5E3